MAVSKISRPIRSTFRYFVPVQTRWNDNDQYGHLNNVVAYELFDTAVNKMLIEKCTTTSAAAQQPPRLGLVVHTQCSYFAPLSFPQTVDVGVAVHSIGASSVTFSVALFASSTRCTPRASPEAPLTDAAVDTDAAAAAGLFVHSYVDRTSRRPLRPLPPPFVAALREFMVSNTDTAAAGFSAHL
eukprot:TRINITY_DN51833_c0_g1_i1.p1 TRINITY_DN51833_c0_g1~~TRINITY_DN51833_c0_g1_i1.p1  ORF type:complete len:184 (+),score=23.25 TRINITY_DN51833_c0_g1_i1:92-643(+)